MQLCFDSVNLTIAHALSSKELSESLLDSFLLTVLAGVYWRKIDDIYACAVAKKNEIVHHVVPLNSLYFHVSTVVNGYYFQFTCFKPLIYEQSFCRGPTVTKKRSSKNNPQQSSGSKKRGKHLNYGVKRTKKVGSKSAS